MTFRETDYSLNLYYIYLSRYIIYSALPDLESFLLYILLSKYLLLYSDKVLLLLQIFELNLQYSSKLQKYLILWIEVEWI